MNLFGTTPYFEVPVRWFEVPMNISRWSYTLPVEAPSPAAPPAVADSAAVAAPADMAGAVSAGGSTTGVGQVLNTHA